MINDTDPMEDNLGKRFWVYMPETQTPYQGTLTDYSVGELFFRGKDGKLMIIPRNKYNMAEERERKNNYGETIQ